MQLRLVAALILFAGSYLPLSLILLAQDGDTTVAKRLWHALMDKQLSFELPFQHAWLSISCFLLCAICFIITMLFLNTLKGKRSVLIGDAEYIPSDLINYTFPYIVSFMGIDYSEKRKLVGLAIFLMWLLWIGYKSGQIVLNPVLIAVGWRLYKISYSYSGENHPFSGMALARRPVIPGRYYQFAIVQDVLVLHD